MARSTGDTETAATRARRTPAEIAQAELDKAKSRLTRAEKRVEKATAEKDAADREVSLARREVDYRAQHPDLAPVASDDEAAYPEDGEAV